MFRVTVYNQSTNKEASFGIAIAIAASNEIQTAEGINAHKKDNDDRAEWKSGKRKTKRDSEDVCVTNTVLGRWKERATREKGSEREKVTEYEK